MKLQTVLFLFFGILIGTIVQAGSSDQTRTRCATVDYVNRLKAENPDYMLNKQRDEAVLQQAAQNQQLSRNSNVIYTIPVVVHVLYKTTAQNISDAQIMSQIDALNEDYGRRNADTTNTPSVWRSIAGTSVFQFCLAKQDPNGNPTNGIERRSTTSSSFSTNNNMKHYSSGGLDAWDVNRYMNIWVCNLGNFLLGYAEPPSGIHSNDYGVVILFDSFGRTGNVSSPYDMGRTTTHEIGHAMGMEHIWGDDNGCTGSDGISDTPNQDIETYGCPSSFPLYDACSPSGSSNGIMYMNYMDYTDDACMNMFTVGQTNRMKLVMEAFYPTLLVSTACQEVTTDISEFADKFSFSVYPNPSDGLINLDMFLMENIGSSVNLNVTNMMGQTVMQDLVVKPTGKTHQLDLRNQDSGIYFITLSNDQYRKTVRFELTK